jgi:hypothetical protein
MAKLSWQELDRGRSHALSIALTLTGCLSAQRKGDNWMLRGLAIHQRTGMWCDFKTLRNGRWVGGRDAVSLVMHLKGCSEAEAVQWTKLFLQNPQYAGYGRSNGDYEDDDGETGDLGDPYIAARYAEAYEYRGLLVPIDGTPGATWIDQRLPGHGPYSSDDVAWLPPNIAHAGDGGVAFMLRCRGVTVGFELHLIDPIRCERSKIKKNRRMYWLDRGRRKGPVTFALFDPPLAQASKLTVGFCEGWFDQESIKRALPELQAVGVPGVHWLPRQQLTRGSTVYLFRDGDVAGSPADKLLITAADHFLLQPDVAVFITNPGQKPDGNKKDTNDYLIEGGIDAVRALRVQALPYKELSFDGRIIQLARMRDGSAEYDAGRRRLKEDRNDKDRDDPHRGIRLETIDKLVGAERIRLGIEDAKDAAASAAAADDETAWFGPIDLGTALQSCADYVGSQVLLPEQYRHLIALFIVFVHMCHQNKGHIRTCFHLKLQSKDPGAGKTELCTALAALLPGSVQTAQGYTAATLRRDILDAVLSGKPNPVLILDEADRLLVEGMITYLNGTTTRGTKVHLNVAQPGGGWEKFELEPFGPAVISGIDDSPPTIASRQVLVFLQACSGEDIEAWQLANGVLLKDKPTEEELKAEEARLEKLEESAALAKAHVHACIKQYDQRLPTLRLRRYLQKQPARLTRNLLQLATIAQLADGEWPQRFEAAVKLMFSVQHEATELTRLLTSIRQAFHDQPEEPERGNGQSDRRLANSRDRMSLPTLIRHLTAELHEDWSRLAELTWRWIARQLLNELDPPGTFEWKTGPRGKQIKHTGYYRAQFEQAWKRHRIPEPTDPDSGRDFDAWQQQQQQPDDSYISPIVSAVGATGDTGPTTDPDVAPVAPATDTIGENYIPPADDLVATVRQLHRDNPGKKLAWLAKQVRQPHARVKAILEAGEAPG